VYLKWQNLFVDYIKKKNLLENEASYCQYFVELRKKYAPTTLQTILGFLNFRSKMENSIDLTKYFKLINFIRLEGKNHVIKQAKVFDELMVDLILNLDDKVYLLYKVFLLNYFNFFFY
jgi:hypothetical protein